MLSKTEGSNYVILERDEIVPVKVNKKKTDDTLEKLQTALKTIKGELRIAFCKAKFSAAAKVHTGNYTTAASGGSKTPYTVFPN